MGMKNKGKKNLFEEKKSKFYIFFNLEKIKIPKKC